MQTLRPLTFKNWDEVERDLQGLLQGYEQRGNWNLAQIALHLHDWISFPMDGFPRASWPMRFLSVIIRQSFGRKLLQRTLVQGFAAGNPTLSVTVHSAAEAGDAEAVEQLRQSITLFRQFTGKLHAPRCSARWITRPQNACNSSTPPTICGFSVPSGQRDEEHLDDSGFLK